MKISPRKRLMAEINVVPYIDVMLVLLVIFMVTAPMLTQGVDVNLPQASANAIDDTQHEPIVVSVDSQGRYYLNIFENPTQTIDAATLVSRIMAEIQKEQGQPGQTQTKPRTVLIKGDKDVDYGRVVGAMVLLQQAGVNNVGLVTTGINQQVEEEKSGK